MLRWCQIVLLLFLSAWTAVAVAAEVVDRVVVVVNQDPILLSDWNEAVRFEALLNERPLGKVTPDQQRAALNRLIDQELVLQQMRSRALPKASAKEVDQHLQELRQQLTGSGGAAAWRDLLARYGLTEGQVRRRLAAQIDMLNFMDAQVLPGVRVENRSILAYYRDQFSPQLRRDGKPVPPLESVAAKIREILTQRQLNELSEKWLRQARAQAEIRVPPAEAASTVSSIQAQ